MTDVMLRYKQGSSFPEIVRIEKSLTFRVYGEVQRLKTENTELKEQVGELVLQVEALMDLLNK